MNFNNCNFTLIKQCYAGGVFCVMAAQCRPSDEGTSLNASPTDEGTSLEFNAQSQET